MYGSNSGSNLVPLPHMGDWQDRIKNGAQKYNIQNELHAWRDNFTCEEAMPELRSDLRDKRWTVDILFSGGLLDTFAAVRSGFTPI